MYVCTFKIYHYGYSGNELPPPVVGSSTIALLSESDETLEAFQDRMRFQGMLIRKTFEVMFGKKTNSKYSQESGCDWTITKVIEAYELLDYVVASDEKYGV